MSASGAVYQPTTVTYDDPCLGGGGGDAATHTHQQRRWSSTNNRASAPVSYLARAIRGRGRCSTCTPSRRTLATLYCSSGVACAAIGLTLVIHGAIGCADDGGCTGVYVTVILVGVAMVVISALLLLLYMRHTRRCCFMYRRKDHLHCGVPTMPNATGGGSSGCTRSTSVNLQVNNPSTDHLLVGAQPTATDAHPEHAHLMPKGDGGASVAAAADDPRILLRPLNAAADVDTDVT